MSIKEILGKYDALHHEADQIFVGISRSSIPDLETELNALIEERAKGFAEWIEDNAVYGAPHYCLIESDYIVEFTPSQLYSLYLDSLTNKTKEA